MSTGEESVVEALRTALAQSGASAVRVHLAQALLAAGQATEAFDACREILAGEPGHLDALALAGHAARALGDDARADRYAEVVAALVLAAQIAATPPAEVVPLRVVSTDGDGDGDGDGDDGAEGGAPPVGRRLPRLADVVGMDEVRRRLELSFLGPLRDPALRALYGKSLRGGLLLWGPPGCGKTFLARAIAGELGAAFLFVGLDDVLGMYAGQSERNLAEVFASARRNAPCVLFFDEIDALGHKRSHQRGSSGRNVVVQLLTELDGVDSHNEGVFVLGATNHPWDVDTALRRPGRLDRMLLVRPPDLAAREAILAKALAGRPTEGLELAAIAPLTEGFSGADLVLLCESATELALAASMAAGAARPIRQADLVAALGDVRESTSDWLAMARNYAEFSADARGAYNELLDYLHVRGKTRR